MNLSTPETLELVRHIFGAKEVPLRLLGRIKEQKEFHRPDWDSVRTSSNNPDLEGFDDYFDFAAPFGCAQGRL
jgi:hypothetical protein